MKTNAILSHARTTLRTLTTTGKKDVVPKLRRKTDLNIETADYFWKIAYQRLPIEYLETSSYDQERVDKAILGTAIVLATLYYNEDRLAHFNPQTNKGVRLGAWLKSARNSSSNPDSFDKKVSDILATTDANLLFRRLHTLVRINKKTIIPLDFGLLASDLYLLQTNAKDSVLFQWGKAYYSHQQNTEK